jgi:hypothetical protein
MKFDEWNPKMFKIPPPFFVSMKKKIGISRTNFAAVAMEIKEWGF